jgi:N-acetylglucosaminyl-diphospho-decaprenol L-rhamnosyltransferase
MGVTAEENAPTRPRIAVVVVTYNSADVLADCLASLRPSDGVDLAAVVVADNNSRDKSLPIAEDAEGLPVHTVQLGRNAGYAAAVNAGVALIEHERERLGRIDAVLVLNPDCRLRPDTLAILARALARPGRGIAAPRLLNPDGSLQPTLRRLPTVGRAIAEAVLGGDRAGRIGSLGELVTSERAHARAGVAAWTTGAAMLISTAMQREIGPWDESFLLYSEETEYALRAADRGYVLWYEPAAVVEHIGGDSGTNPALAALVVVNKVKLFRRRHGRIASGIYYGAFLLGQGARALAGRATSRAAVAALLRPSRRPTELAS